MEVLVGQNTKEPRAYRQFQAGRLLAEAQTVLGRQAWIPGAGLEPLESELGLVRAGLAEVRDAAEELRQKAAGGSSSLDKATWVHTDAKLPNCIMHQTSQTLCSCQK